MEKEDALWYNTERDSSAVMMAKPAMAPIHSSVAGRLCP